MQLAEADLIDSLVNVKAKVKVKEGIVVDGPGRPGHTAAVT